MTGAGGKPSTEANSNGGINEMIDIDMKLAIEGDGCGWVGNVSTEHMITLLLLGE